MVESYVGNDAVLKYFGTYDRKTWNYEHFLNELKEIIINSPPDTQDWSGLDGTWYNRYIYHAKDDDNRRQMKSFFQDIILERENRNAGKNYVIEGVKILNEARFSSSNEIISTINKRHTEDQASRNEDTSYKFVSDDRLELEPIIGQKRSYEEKPPSTPPDKIRIICAESPPYQQCDDPLDDDSIALVNKLSVPQKDSNSKEEAQSHESPETISESDNNKTNVNIKPSDSMPSNVLPEARGKKYINRDLADEVLKSFQMHVLPNHKLIYDDVDVMDHDLKNILQDNEVDSIHFSKGKYIDKFLVDCEEEVIKYLENFHNINNLQSLAECLDKNRINHSTSSNDLIYVENLFLHFLLLYKNDVLTQSLTESEFNAYVWTPLLRNVFLGKNDLKLKCGEVASKSYDKLKEILNIVTRSGPRLDGKGFLKSLGTEILAQEDGAINTQSKRTGDLRKLDLQSNEFRLKISASKFLFEDTIITIDLAHIKIPRTVEGFSKLIVGVKAIISWKARTRKNTMIFYEILKEGNKRLNNGVFFSPIKIPT
ncbi:hypothetical protein Glove_261g52 [Diversispora epigaea]|uniref:Uncharacterized protein n=1 Tax=Diversispora epigaea TaxID=1348612 RepID=A0A397IEP6_9GLOM|nr:hypothetical protein Glove_261g52 [Diversispora epigaea]